MKDEGIIMIHVLLSDRGQVIGLTDTFGMIKCNTKHRPGYGLSYAVACELVRQLHLLNPARNLLVLPEPKGRTTTYRIVIAPQVGDQVCSVLDGDYLPAGIIVKTSPTFKRIETSTGDVFQRHSNSCRWTCGSRAMSVVSRAIKLDNGCN